MGGMRREPVRTVSVVTVCYNARDVIRLTLDSVKRQTFPGVEHVVIDGGSKDGTQDIVREFDVAYFVSEPDKGIYDAMEKGARAARGDILIFLNAGDLFYDRDVCADVAKFFSDAGADLVFGNLMPAYQRPSDSHDHGAFRSGDLLDLSYYSNRRRIYDESIHHQATFYRRWIFSKCSYYCDAPEANGEYNVLMSAVMRQNAVVKHIPRPISRFMLGGTSTKNFAEEWARYTAARDALRGLYCPDPKRIKIDSETEFLYQPPEPAPLRTKKWLKGAIKASPPFKIYDRLAHGLSMRAAGAVQPHLASLGAGVDRLDAGVQKNFALIGSVLDRVAAQGREQARALELALSQIESLQRQVDTQARELSHAAAREAEAKREGAALAKALQQNSKAHERLGSEFEAAKEAVSRASERLSLEVDAIQRAAAAWGGAMDVQFGALSARLDQKLTPVELAVAQASERMSAEIGTIERATAELRAAMDGQFGDMSVRLDGKLTPVELAVAQASERMSAEIGGVERAAADLRTAMDGQFGDLSARLDGKLTPVELAVAQASERMSAEIGSVERQVGGLDARLSQALAQGTERLSAEIGGYGHELADALRAGVEDLAANVRDVSEHSRLALASLSEGVDRGSDMADYGFRAFSQWDEDGLIQFLVSRAAVAEKTFIEIGVGDYSEANTRLLLLKDNWRGAVVDCDPAAMEALKAQPLYWRHSLTAIADFVTAENVNDVIRSSGLSGDIGLLSIDIDGMDYWVWKAIDAVSPQIMVCEFNGWLGDGAPLTTPYDPQFDRRKAHYSWLYAGASLPALIHLGREKGYTFVGCNLAGNNAFFLRDDVFGRSGLAPSRRRFVEPLFREARTSEGALAFPTPAQVHALLAPMTFEDVRSGARVRLKDAKA